MRESSKSITTPIFCDRILESVVAIYPGRIRDGQKMASAVITFTRGPGRDAVIGNHSAAESQRQPWAESLIRWQKKTQALRALHRAACEAEFK